jgi:hypothetical protein
MSPMNGKGQTEQRTTKQATAHAETALEKGSKLSIQQQSHNREKVEENKDIISSNGQTGKLSTLPRR